MVSSNQKLLFILLLTTVLITISQNARIQERLGKWIQTSTENAANVTQEILPQPPVSFQLKHLREFVQDKLETLQNPSNCTTARKLLCKVKAQCGMGCRLHHISTCLLLATGTNRTLVLDMILRGYSKVQSITDAYLPLSGTCDWSETEYNEAETIQGDGEVEITAGKRVVKLTVTGVVKPFTHFAPFTYPGVFKEYLKPFGDDSHAWWLGQLMIYITRMQPSLRQEMKEIKAKMGFDHPVVGIHVRRTDKLAHDAKLHEIREYMLQAEQWFQERNVTERRIFLATDDIAVYDEAKKKYPQYKFMCLSDNAYYAQMKRRRSDEAFWGILKDISLLGECDFVVCTFSSNIGRMTHEMLLARSDDQNLMSSISIDIGWFFYGMVNIDNIAIEDHNATKKNELEFRTGDVIKNAWCRINCKGTNTRTGQKGSYPETKVRKIPLPAPYALFKNISLPFV